MNYQTMMISQNSEDLLQQYTLDKHYNRKHGKNAYYGQNG